MADAKDVTQLARRLRNQGLDEAQVVEGLRGLGFSKAEAEAAAPLPVPKPAPTPAASATTTPRGGGTPPGPPPAEPAASKPATPGAAGVPSFSAPSLPSLSGVTLTPPKRVSAGDIGGFLAGLVFYALLLNYIRFGPDGPKSWARAKFLNDPNPALDKGLPRPRSASSQERANEAQQDRGDQLLDGPGVGIGLNLNRPQLPGDFSETGDGP